MPRYLLLLALGSFVFVAPVGEAQEGGPPLDFQFFKDKVQPIFLAQRPGMARCYSCHGAGQVLRRAPQYLQRLSPGATTWNEEQSRKNFELVSKEVVPANLRQSKLLTRPLRAEAGGDASHAGGKHWMSPNDPEWQILAAWVRGQKASSGK